MTNYSSHVNFRCGSHPPFWVDANGAHLKVQKTRGGNDCNFVIDVFEPDELCGICRGCPGHPLDHDLKGYLKLFRLLRQEYAELLIKERFSIANPISRKQRRACLESALLWRFEFIEGFISRVSWEEEYNDIQVRDLLALWRDEAKKEDLILEKCCETGALGNMEASIKRLDEIDRKWARKMEKRGERVKDTLGWLKSKFNSCFLAVKQEVQRKK